MRYLFCCALEALQAFRWWCCPARLARCCLLLYVCEAFCSQMFRPALFRSLRGAFCAALRCCFQRKCCRCRCLPSACGDVLSFARFVFVRCFRQNCRRLLCSARFQLPRNCLCQRFSARFQLPRNCRCLLLSARFRLPRNCLCQRFSARFQLPRNCRCLLLSARFRLPRNCLCQRFSARYLLTKYFRCLLCL